MMSPFSPLTRGRGTSTGDMPVTRRGGEVEIANFAVILFLNGPLGYLDATNEIFRKFLKLSKCSFAIQNDIHLKVVSRKH